MDHTRCLLVLHSGLHLLVVVCGLSSPSRPFHFVSEPKSWEDARGYCRERHVDLATVEDMEDMNRLQQSLEPKHQGDVWIGLKRGLQQHWFWTLSGRTTLQYQHWQPGMPNGGGNCVLSHGKSGWYDYSCAALQWFLCYSENHPARYVLVKQGLTWLDAQSYCRQKHTDLAMIESQQDEEQVWNIGQGNSVWIGLIRDSWEWVEQATRPFRYWGAWANEGEDCVAMRTSGSGKWYSHRCNVTHPFVCLTTAIKRQVVRLVVLNKEGVNLNDPDVMAEMLEQIRARLKQRGLSDGAKLQWRKNKDGKVFVSMGGKEMRKKRADEL